MNTIAAIVVLPLISGLIAAGMSKKYEKHLEGFAVLVTAVCLVLSVVIAATCPHWEFEVFSVTLSFTSGGFHSGMSILAAFLWFVTSVFSKE